MTTTTCLSLVSNINQQSSVAAGLLDAYFRNKKTRLETAMKESTSPDLLHMVQEASNLWLDQSVEAMKVEIPMLAVVYDAYVRAAVGESYDRADLLAFLNTRSGIYADTFGISYVCSSTEMKVLQLIKNYYAG